MSDFDDRSGIIACVTPWGRWWQTIDDVTVEVNVPDACRAKEIQCSVTPRSLSLAVRGNTVFKGELHKTVQADDSVWTLEDGRLVRICLVKADKTAGSCWLSLLTDQFVADPFVADQMQQKLTLQRFQLENPGMDFSGASVTGNYAGGGPELPS